MKKLLIAFCCLAATAQGQTYLMEYFNYGTSSDTLCSTGGVTSNWTPHAAAGSNPVKYQNSGLSYTGYSGASTSSGSLQFVNGTGTRESVNAAVTGVSSGSVYLSFLLRITNGGGANTLSDYFIHFNDTFGSSLSSGDIGRIFIQNVMLVPAFKFGLSKGSGSSGAVFYSTQFSLSTTVLMIMRYTFKTGSTSNDSVYAWFYSSGVPATEPAPHLIATDMSVPDLSQIRSVCVRQGGIISSTATIDAMRLGTSWGNTVLPVKFTDFKASANKGEVTLDWTTASEVNNSHFEIERSADNARWDLIGKIRGKGTTHSASNYQFKDNIHHRPLPHHLTTSPSQNLYYRLKQVDLDGTAAWSQIETVDLGNTPDLIRAQNPFHHELVLTHGYDSPSEIQLELFDVSGRRWINEKRMLSRDEPQISIDTRELPPGIYFLKAAGKTIKMLKD